MRAEGPARHAGSRAASDRRPGGGLVDLRDASQQLERLAERVGPSVVQVLTLGTPAGTWPTASGACSWRRPAAPAPGVIVDAGGYIVTNAHVVQGAHRIQVELPVRDSGVPGRSLVRPRPRLVGAQLVAIDEETDLAVVKVSRARPAGAGVCRLRRGAPGTDRDGVWQSAGSRQLGHARRGQRHRAAARGRRPDGLPPDRRAHQSREQRRAAGEPGRADRRDQHADPDAVGRQRRAGVCGAEQHRAARVRADSAVRARAARRDWRARADHHAAAGRGAAAGARHRRRVERRVSRRGRRQGRRRSRRHRAAARRQAHGERPAAAGQPVQPRGRRHACASISSAAGPG